MSPFSENIIPENPVCSSRSDSLSFNKAFKPSKASTPPFSNKVLIITYYWPPSGGAGVQRWLKFAKYLPQFGWEPVILTVDPDSAAYPVRDNSLVADIPPSLKVHTSPAVDYFSIYRKDKSKIPTAGFANNVDNTFKGKLIRFVRGNFFIPDPRKGWNKNAFKKACSIIESEGIKHVITTSPPHSTQLIGLKIKKKYPAIKWIADLRDPWTDIYYYKQFYPTILSKFIDSGMEKKVLSAADRIITVGDSLKNLFSSKVSGITGKIHVISNGYDEDDFNNLSIKSPTRFTITYVGTLSDIYPVSGLISAMKRLSINGKDFLFRFVGSVSGNARKMLISDIPEKSLEFLPYVAHSEAIQHMVNASVLILIIPEHESSRSILTGKIFEYIAAGKPVLCLGPVDGDAAEVINKCRSGITVDYYDENKMFDFLTEIEGKSWQSDISASIEYSRTSLSKELAGVLK